VPNLINLEEMADKFLKIPTCVLVGELDIELTASLDQRPEINLQQGMTRVERGQRWYEAMHEAAKKRGINTFFYYQTLPKSGHGFTQCMDNGNMGPLIFKFLFEDGMVD
jgi:hypothetical protein